MLENAIKIFTMFLLCIIVGWLGRALMQFETCQSWIAELVPHFGSSSAIGVVNFSWCLPSQFLTWFCGHHGRRVGGRKIPEQTLWKSQRTSVAAVWKPKRPTFGHPDGCFLGTRLSAALVASVAKPATAGVRPATAVSQKRKSLASCARAVIPCTRSVPCARRVEFPGQLDTKPS